MLHGAGFGRCPVSSPMSCRYGATPLGGAASCGTALFFAGFRSRAADRMIRPQWPENEWAMIGGNDMDKELIVELARAAGLDKALAQFP
ncbi:MAG: hypothetical protein WAL10_24350, partial [Acetobacteraceae bacterium]